MIELAGSSLVHRVPVPSGIQIEAIVCRIRLFRSFIAAALEHQTKRKGKELQLQEVR